MSPATLTSRLMLLGVLSILGGSSVAMDEAAAGSSGAVSATGTGAGASSGSPVAGTRGLRYVQYYDPAGQLIGGKRAYNYRTEYKRLPLLYQFGLGKRLSVEDKRGQPFSFGLGKRSPRQYSFGLGKRGYEDEDERLAYASSLADRYAQMLAQKYLETKRASDFNFGLGKRDSELDSYIRDYDLQERLPVKHSRNNPRYEFGLGKRSEDELEDEPSELAGSELV